MHRCIAFILHNAASLNTPRESGMRHQLSLHYLDTVARIGSIRKAADQHAITSSALNRRIIAMEDDLGVPIFDRVANGVRLNTAGELLIQHARAQLADMERVKSQIHDLQGVRRGHISIVASQALMPYIIPLQIKAYRSEHPQITFSVRVCTRFTALTELQSYSADLAVVFEPELAPEFESVFAVPQQLHAQFNRDHSLAGGDGLRLRECLQWPLALPTKNNGIRHLLEQSASPLSSKLNVAIESDNAYLLQRVVETSELISFALTAGVQDNDELASLRHRSISSTDVKPGMLHIGRLKGRHLSVAAAKFLDQITEFFDT